MCGIGLTLLPNRDITCSCSCCSPNEPQPQSQSRTTSNTKDSNIHIKTTKSCPNEKNLLENISKVLHARGPDLPCGYYKEDIDIHTNGVLPMQEAPISSTTTESNDDDDGVNTTSLLPMYKEQRTKTSTETTIQMNQLGSVLHLRGAEITPQPLQSAHKNKQYSLCWNGECYDYTNHNKDIHDLWNDNQVSDTNVILDLLTKNEHKEEEYHTVVTNTFNRIYGEYAFILYHANPLNGTKCAYFGRDPLGRRSLLVSNTNDGFILSSTSFSSSESQIDLEFEEVVAGRIYCLDLYTGHLSYKSIHLDGYTRIEKQLPRLREEGNSLGCLHHAILFPNVSTSMIDASNDLFLVLNNAVRKRVTHVPIPSPPCTTSITSEDEDSTAPVAILFSGGLDSVILAVLAHFHAPSHHPIDLLNVSFQSSTHQETSPDRLAAYLSLQELTSNYPSRDWRLIEINVSFEEEVMEQEVLLSDLIYPLNTVMDFNIACAFWYASRGAGIYIPTSDATTPPSDSTPPLIKEQEERHQILIANHKKKEKVLCSMKHCTKLTQEGCIFQSCKLCCKCYQRPINKFLGAAALVCPTHNSNTTAKPKSKKQASNNTNGLLRQYHTPKSSKVTSAIPQHYKSKEQFYKSIQSKSKVLLSGLGADEFMGGYGRHRTAYKQGGIPNLKSVLSMEQKRLWKRNLGRDDRTISSHGKEVRYPFLDVDVIQYLTSPLLDVSNICDLEKEEGYGDKMILRLIASRLGMYECSCLVKRAIQFGSRIAKASNVTQFGSHRKACGTALYELHRGNLKG